MRKNKESLRKDEDEDEERQSNRKEEGFRLKKTESEVDALKLIRQKLKR